MIGVVDAVRYLDPELEAGVRSGSLSWAEVIARVSARLDNEGLQAAGVVLDANDLVGDKLEQADRALADTDGRVFGWYGVSPKQLTEVRRLSALKNAPAFRGVHVAPYRGCLTIDQPDWYVLYSACQDQDLILALEVGSAPARSGLYTLAEPDLLDTVAFAFPNLRLLCVNRGRLWLPTLVRWARVHKHFYLAVGDNLERDWDETLLESITHPVDYWHPDGARKTTWCSAVSSKSAATLVDKLLSTHSLNEEQVAGVMGLNIEAIAGLELSLSDRSSQA